MFLETLSSLNNEPLRLEPWQKDLLNIQDRFIVVNKSCQIGFSLIAAAWALHRALVLGVPQIFVSVNLKEARHKVRYAKSLYLSLPKPFQLPMVADSSDEIAFLRPDDQVVYITSLPASSGMRGRHGDILLDELAHFSQEQADELFPAAISRVARGYRLLCGSSPWGAMGLFYELFANREQYPDFVRRQYPWGVLTNPEVRASIELIKRNTAKDIFEQEFCCKFTADVDNYFSHALINSVCHSEVELVDTMDSLEGRGPLFAGLDVGRHNNPSVLIVFEEVPGKTLVMRFMRSYKKMSFDSQENELAPLLRMPNLTKIAVDCSGLGMGLGERLKRLSPGKVDEIQISQQSKQSLVETTKTAFENKTVRLVNDPALKREIFSIRKIVTNTGVRYDTRMQGASHADQFSALALAVYAARGRRRDYQIRWLWAGMDDD